MSQSNSDSNDSTPEVDSKSVSPVEPELVLEPEPDLDKDHNLAILNMLKIREVPEPFKKKKIKFAPGKGIKLKTKVVNVTDDKLVDPGQFKEELKLNITVAYKPSEQPATAIVASAKQPTVAVSPDTTSSDGIPAFRPRTAAPKPNKSRTARSKQPGEQKLTGIINFNVPDKTIINDAPKNELLDKSRLDMGLPTKIIIIIQITGEYFIIYE